MKQVVLVHGAEIPQLDAGSGDWQSGLQTALGSGYEVMRPQMPNPENPRYEAWKARVEALLAERDRELILVGHSLGGAVLLKVLAENDLGGNIAGLFSVSTPCFGCEDKDWDVPEFALGNDLRKLERIPRIFLYHSRDDEVVPFAHLAAYERRLPRATLRAVDNRGHYFNSRDFPEIVDDIRRSVER